METAHSADVLFSGLNLAEACILPILRTRRFLDMACLIKICLKIDVQFDGKRNDG